MPPQNYRLPLMLLTFIALLAGLWAGLVRLGWSWPPLRPSLPATHGPLMVSGFLGTLISLERGVAIGLVIKLSQRQKWLFYVGPACSGLGALVLVSGVSQVVGAFLLWLSSAGLLVIFALILYRHRAMHTAVMTLGALSWLVGNSLWLLGQPIHQVVWWWACFLIFTIAGERLELSRLTKLTAKRLATFGTAVILILLGLILSHILRPTGIRLLAVGLLGLAVWLLRYDIARHTIRQTGLPRFIAACLLSGYIWLFAAGAMILFYGYVAAGVYYDAILHAIFLGFVFTMIFGHAPIILPAILNVSIPFRTTFYTHLILLHLSLLLRMIGDLWPWQPARLWGGLFNVLVLFLFLVNTAVAVRGGRHKLG